MMYIQDPIMKNGKVHIEYAAINNKMSKMSRLHIKN